MGAMGVIAVCSLSSAMRSGGRRRSVAGVFSSIPLLNQYWHPYRLGGTATGLVEFGTQRWSFDGAKLYAERNWGAGFPERWWWGQAHDFGGADVSVAFSGGLLRLGPVRRDVTGVVVRLGRQVIRLTPPMPVRCAVGRSSMSKYPSSALRAFSALARPCRGRRQGGDRSWPVTALSRIAGRLHRSACR